MRPLETARRGSSSIALCIGGAAVGFFAPSAAWPLGLVPVVLAGGGLTALGLSLGWKNRYVAFVSGLWPLSVVSTAMIVLIEWGASGLD